MGPRAGLDRLEKTAFYLFIHPSLDLSIHPFSLFIAAYLLHQNYASFLPALQPWVSLGLLTSELYKTNLKGMHLAGNIEIDQECCFTYKTDILD